MDIERYLGKYVGMLIRSYNPDHYVRLMELPWKRYVKFAAATLAVSLAIFLATFIFVSARYINDLPDTLEQVDTFHLSAEVETDHEVVLLSYPSIVLDMNATGGKHDVVFTREGLFYPTFIFFGESFVPWDGIADLKQQTAERDRMLFALVLFLLPSIIFWFAVLSLLKLILVFGALVLLGYVLPRMFRYRMRFGETVKTAILAMPSVMFIGLGLSPVAPRPMFWWGTLVTVLVFALGVLLLSEGIKYKRDTR